MISLVGGARLTKGGIHLGHYVGNLLPLLDFDGPKRYVFVIKDTEPLSWLSNEEKKNTLIDMTSDVLSLPFSESILITTSSRILPKCYILFSMILDTVSYNTLITTHFRKNELRNQTTSTTVKNFLFPIDEATTLLGLKADFFVSNDDNQRIVSFSRDIARKLNSNIKNNFFPLPQLKHHKLVSRISGADYTRMCKAHNNIIRISENADVLYEKIGHLTSWKTYFSHNPAALEEYNSNKNNFVFHDDYLPFLYWHVLSDTELTREKATFYSRIENKEKLHADLFEIVNSKLHSIRDTKSHWLDHSQKIGQRIEHDSEIVRHAIESNMKNLRKLVFSK